MVSVAKSATQKTTTNLNLRATLTGTEAEDIYSDIDGPPCAAGIPEREQSSTDHYWQSHANLRATCFKKFPRHPAIAR